MEGEFSQSLTPPVSPSALEHYGESAPSQPPCFTCAYEPVREETGRLSSNGYISRGALKRLLLKLDPAPVDFEGDTVDIFDFPWVTETALVESTKLLFGLFRQKVLKLETLVQSSSLDFGQASSLHYEAEQLRQQCVLFLSYIKPTQSIDEGPVHPFKDAEAQVPSVLVEELFSITLFIGRIKNLPANVQSALTIQHQGKECVTQLNMRQLLSVGMDGPNVNFKLVDLLQKEHAELYEGAQVVTVGSCGLHTIHNALKAGFTMWQLEQLLRAMHFHFHNVPARREELTSS